MLPVELELAAGLKALGFKKKARTWMREDASVFQLLNIQKSQFGEQMYVNVAVYLKALGPETAPPERRCHIRARLERIAPKELFEDIRTLDASLPPLPGLLKALYEYAIPWLELVSNAEGRKAFFNSPEASHCFINVKALTE